MGSLHTAHPNWPERSCLAHSSQYCAWPHGTRMYSWGFSMQTMQAESSLDSFFVASLMEGRWKPQAPSLSGTCSAGGANAITFVLFDESLPSWYMKRHLNFLHWIVSSGTLIQTLLWEWFMLSSVRAHNWIQKEINFEQHNKLRIFFTCNPNLSLYSCRGWYWKGRSVMTINTSLPTAISPWWGWTRYLIMKME